MGRFVNYIVSWKHKNIEHVMCGWNIPRLNDDTVVREIPALGGWGAVKKLHALSAHSRNVRAVVEQRCRKRFLPL